MAVGACGDELPGDQPVLGGGDVEAGAARACGHLLPGPAGELAAGRGTAAHRLGDGVERHTADVVQHEGDPLGRAELLQHDEQRELTPSSNVTRSAGSARARPAGGAMNSISMASWARSLRERADLIWSRPRRLPPPISHPPSPPISPTF